MNLENKYPIVRVKWIDSGAGHGWTADLVDICTIESVGFLIEDSKDKVVLCESLCLTEGTKKYGCNTAIPRSQIKEMQLKYGCNTAIPRSQIKEMQLLSMPRGAVVPPSETKEATGSDIRQKLYGPGYGIHSQ